MVSACRYTDGNDVWAWSWRLILFESGVKICGGLPLLGFSILYFRNQFFRQKNCRMWRKTAEHYEKLWNVPKNLRTLQKLQNVAKKLRNVTKNRGVWRKNAECAEKSANATETAERCEKLRNVTKNCGMWRKNCRTRRKLQNVTKNCRTWRKNSVIKLLDTMQC